jgi:recombination protein RecR
MKYTSALIQEAVESLSALPGIGRKTALRLALFLAKQDPARSLRLAESIQRMVEGLRECSICFAYSDSDVCEICSNPGRDRSTICLVETVRDLMAIEETQQYKGLYHVLGGLISPIEGIGPDQLNIAGLVKRVATNPPQELIIALRPCIEGDTTIYYISRQEGMEGIRLSMIARGISFGSELEYADEFTLSRSLAGRIPYHPKDNS